jgi:ABC-type nickel/cobalt efflux system permease component RcnA
MFKAALATVLRPALLAAFALALLLGLAASPPSIMAQPTRDGSAASQSAPPKSFLPNKTPPEGAARGPVAAPPSGLFASTYAWIMARQQEVNRGLADAIRRLKQGEGMSAALVLAGLSFAYGILHAAGPGHGKAVISSYVLADGRTMRRGVMLAFLAALVQAFSALVLVGILVLAMRSTRNTITNTELWLERASWAFVALFGAWLLWRQLRPLLARASDGAHNHAHGANHAHAPHDHSTHDHHDHAHHHHDHAHGDACETCGHVHMPAPTALEKDWSWRRALALAFAIGIRPCTGAILVLVFAISQGLMWAGVFATFAMALGTAITVSVLAALAVGSRDLAEKLARSRQPTWAGYVGQAAGVAGAALVMILGATFFYYSLNGSGPL